MLQIGGPKHNYCDGVSRRNFLQVGSLAAGSLTAGGLCLPQLLRAESQPGHKLKHKSVIMVYLTGGISHQDTFDLKPSAPEGIRGEFKPIASKVPGFDVCELLPKLAQSAVQYSVIRSIVGLRDEHSSFQSVTGYSIGETQRDGKPNFGSAISRVLGQVNPITPAYVDLFPTMQHRPYNIPGPGYFGHSHAGVKADGEDLASMRLRYVAPEQLTQRRVLREAFDAQRREFDGQIAAGMDVAYQRAFDVLTSSRLVEALNAEKEDPAVRERYGKGSKKHLGDGAPMWNDQLLIARRLVEEGVRCVTVAYGFWDTHGNHFKYMRDHLPLFDTGISALIEDLKQRGLDQDVMVVVWGEFGRTPKINKDAGRDHWARVANCVIAGGGLKSGLVIGSTDKLGDSAAARPVNYLDVLYTIYHTLGIDPHEFVRDVNDRPVPLLPESARLIHELV